MTRASERRAAVSLRDLVFGFALKQNTMATARTHRRFGEILLDEGLLSPDQLDEALDIQQRTGEVLGLILKDMGLVTESDIAKIVCIQYQLPFLSLSNYEMDKKLVELFDPIFLHKHRMLPFDQVGRTLLILVTEIPDERALAEIPSRTGLNAALYVGFTSEVEGQLNILSPLPEEEKKKKKAAEAARVRAAQHQDEEEEDDEALFGSDGESLLQELDSTWDSIFEQLDTGEGDDESKTEE